MHSAVFLAETIDAKAKRQVVEFSVLGKGNCIKVLQGVVGVLQRRFKSVPPSCGDRVPVT